MADVGVDDDDASCTVERTASLGGDAAEREKRASFHAEIRYANHDRGGRQ